SVFINRLRAGMRLQSDPTVLYGLRQAGEEVATLLRRHWEHQSPWNTYRIPGLPITPICNPGEASLQAVLQPQETGYYYFVANGTGGHAFAKTLGEHNRNVRAWQAIKKQQSQ
ncbi:MAG: endolytic transglycosylase MltG, partial [Alphaproteobacteria bacterium]|nr:endolytic transglycosylase MltG [Alphaproteobacteria bacterium]